jgi:spore germination protein PC
MSLQQNLTQLLMYLQQTVQSQNEAICKLENNLAQVQGELLELKQQNPVRIDKIEYNFDQLKIERLEGTLNIGLSPNDLNNIDELAINAEPSLDPFNFPMREDFVRQLTDEILSEFQKDKEEVFTQAERYCNRKADEDMRSFIMEDLARQLPQRIHHYLDQTPPYNRHEHKLPQVREQILEVTKSDIQNAINRFLQVYPESMKENA